MSIRISLHLDPTLAYLRRDFARLPLVRTTPDVTYRYSYRFRHARQVRSHVRQIMKSSLELMSLLVFGATNS